MTKIPMALAALAAMACLLTGPAMAQVGNNDTLAGPVSRQAIAASAIEIFVMVGPQISSGRA